MIMLTVYMFVSQIISKPPNQCQKNLTQTSEQLISYDFMEMGSQEEDRDLVTITCNEKAAA